MSSKFVFHHGSPGTPQDFRHLCQELNISKPIVLDRNKTKKQDAQGNIQVGYSFGCFHALNHAVLNLEQTQAVILIAPYLFVDKKMNPLLQAILKTPFVSDFLLKKMGPKSIDKLLSSSSHPLPVPESYRLDATQYYDPQVLKQAIFEKIDILPRLAQIIETLKNHHIPIYLIRGANDQTSPLDQQITPLKKRLQVTEYCLEEAGHALLWTHPKRIAEIMNEVLEEKQKGSKLGYFDGAHIKNNVCSFLDKHLVQIPDQPILSWVSPENLKQWSFRLSDPLPHDSITVLELDHLVGRIGAGLSQLGLEKGDRVIIFVPMSLYLYAAMFAVQKIGAIAVFLDSWARRDQLGLSAKAVSPKAMISVEQAFEYMKDVKQIQDIEIKISVGPIQKKYNAQLEHLMHTPAQAYVQAVEKEDTALVTFTTGSSGTPKGANRTHRFLAAQHYALNRHLPYGPGDSDLPAFPIFSLNNLAAGVRTIIPAIDVGTPSEHDALILIAQMKSTNTTCTTLSPSLLNKVSAFCLEHNLKLDFLRRIITGGAPVSKDDLIRITSVCPNAIVLVLYGSTEVEPMAHIEAQEMIHQKTSDDPEWVDDGVNVGKMDQGLEVKFIKISPDPIYIKQAQDWGEIELPLGRVGEIIVSGEHVCESYFNNEEAFFRAKIRDEKGKVWHRTGDLGRLDNDHNLWLVARVHNAIKRDNQYAFPVRSEIIMKKLSFIKHCAYLGVPDSKLGERTVCVFTSHSQTNDESQIQQWHTEINRLMEKNQVPVDQIIYTDTIPMDPRHHSKVEYSVLREQLKMKGLIS